MTQDISLFKALGAKMQYLDANQTVIAQNIANADTPGYQTRQLSELDFGSLLDKVKERGRMNVSMNATDAKHLGAGLNVDDVRNKDQKITYEVAPAGNAVVLEEEMVKSSQNTMDYNMVTNLYTKHVAMMKVALGRGQ
jgi:flagellar basal-body rod protein FlgB